MPSLFALPKTPFGKPLLREDLVVFDLVDQPDLNFTLTEDFSISCPGDDAELIRKAFACLDSNAYQDKQRVA